MIKMNIEIRLLFCFLTINIHMVEVARGNSSNGRSRFVTILLKVARAFFKSYGITNQPTAYHWKYLLQFMVYYFRAFVSDESTNQINRTKNSTVHHSIEDQIFARNRSLGRMVVPFNL
ncbi:hypothetical protein Plhal304r1_c035g0109771 [Plasmopara halstedii]